MLQRQYLEPHGPRQIPTAERFCSYEWILTVGRRIFLSLCYHSHMLRIKVQVKTRLMDSHSDDRQQAACHLL